MSLWVTRLDWIALGLVVLTGLVGLRKGSSRACSRSPASSPARCSARGSRRSCCPAASHSPYAPLVALGGAVIGAAVLEALGSMAGSFFRSGLRFPPLRALDTAGGLVLGAAAGLALVWVFGAAALLLPGQRSLRESVQRSEVLRRLNDIVPPERLLNALARVDPFPSIAGPAIPAEPPTPDGRNDPVVRAAAPSVVRVLGTACGLGISGSGWVAAPGVVVTAAHVVAGEREHVRRPVAARRRAAAGRGDRLRPEERRRRPARSGPHGARRCALAEPEPGASVAIVGYPLNGPLDVEPGRVGRTATVLTDDAYGQRAGDADDHEPRRGDPARQLGRPGDRQRRARAGDGLRGAGRRRRRLRDPGEVVRKVLAAATAPVSTGDCAPSHGRVGARAPATAGRI